LGWDLNLESLVRRPTRYCCCHRARPGIWK